MLALKVDRDPAGPSLGFIPDLIHSPISKQWPGRVGKRQLDDLAGGCSGGPASRTLFNRPLVQKRCGKKTTPLSELGHLERLDAALEHMLSR